MMPSALFYHTRVEAGSIVWDPAIFFGEGTRPLNRYEIADIEHNARLLVIDGMATITHRHAGHTWIFTYWVDTEFDRLMKLIGDFARDPDLPMFTFFNAGVCSSLALDERDDRLGVREDREPLFQ